MQGSGDGRLSRNQRGLTEHQIEYCHLVWVALGGLDVCPLDASEADRHGTTTAYLPEGDLVRLGADVYPSSSGWSMRDTMPVECCLAHELAHAQRERFALDRPFSGVDYLKEEAETSLHASYNDQLSPQQRLILVRDAYEVLASYLEKTADL